MSKWNPWHGCTKISPGCYHCYMFRQDSDYGRDSTIVHKTKAFDLPVRKNRKGEYKLRPDGDYVYTCFTSDFFHPSADEWRGEAWQMIKQRPDLTFFIVTKRSERFYKELPEDWGDGYENVHICCTCENQATTGKRHAQEYESIWDETEYQALFLTDGILEENEDYIFVKDCPKLVIQDFLKPLQDGEKVRLIE